MLTIAINRFGTFLFLPPLKCTGAIYKMWSRWLREDVYRQWLMHDDKCQPTGICHPIKWPRWHLTRGPQATSLTWETSSNQLTVITAKLWLYQNVSILQNWMLCIHKTLSPLQPRTLLSKFGWNTLVSKHSSDCDVGNFSAHTLTLVGQS